jgi:hypothetical protein
MLLMKRSITIFAAGVVAIAPAIAFAAPPASGSLSPHATTGQPGVECDDGTPPGNSAEDHGNTNVNGSPFGEGTSVSGSHYAGEQAGINDKNTASVSQYDIACFRGPDRPSGG